MSDMSEWRARTASRKAHRARQENADVHGGYVVIGKHNPSRFETFDPDTGEFAGTLELIRET